MLGILHSGKHLSPYYVIYDLEIKPQLKRKNGKAVENSEWRGMEGK